MSLALFALVAFGAEACSRGEKRPRAQPAAAPAQPVVPEANRIAAGGAPGAGVAEIAGTADGANGAGGTGAVGKASAGTGEWPKAAAVPTAIVLGPAALKAELAKAKGHVLVVQFWASWCGPCMEELPLMNELARSMREKGAKFLSLSLDDLQRTDVVRDTLVEHAPELTPFVAEVGDPDKFVPQFSKDWQGTIPALFLYDRAGMLKGNVFGEVTPADTKNLLTAATRL